MSEVTSKINVATGFSGGVSVSLRADSAAEFEALLSDARQSPHLAALLSALPAVQVNANDLSIQQAENVIVGAFPGAQPVSTVGQPLPQPGAVAQPVAQPQQAAVGAPPNVPYPGNCAHGVRQYVDKPARGKAWRRWECSIPWSKDNAAQRCKPINVEG